MMNLTIRSSVVFSPCEKYRYVLRREWGDGGRFVNFLMLNPSTADGTKNDPTIERQMRRVMKWEYKHPLGPRKFDGLIVTNLFAWRSTDPNALLEIYDPVGPDNDRHIIEQAKASELVICGWGSHKAVTARVPKVLAALRAADIVPHALKVTTGQPWHPLYVSYSAVPFPIIVTKGEIA